MKSPREHWFETEPPDYINGVIGLLSAPNTQKAIQVAFAEMAHRASLSGSPETVQARLAGAREFIQILSSLGKKDEPKSRQVVGRLLAEGEYDRRNKK